MRPSQNILPHFTSELLLAGARNITCVLMNRKTTVEYFSSFYLLKWMDLEWILKLRLYLVSHQCLAEILLIHFNRKTVITETHRRLNYDYTFQFSWVTCLCKNDSREDRRYLHTDSGIKTSLCLMTFQCGLKFENSLFSDFHL